MLLKKSLPPLADIPKTKDLAPRIAGELNPKKLSLGQEKAALLVESKELALAETPSSDFIDAERERRVAEILGKIPPQPKKTRAGRQLEIAERVRDIDAAVEILNREIEIERNRAAAIVRERVAGQHKALVGDICRALVGAHQANVAYWRLIETLQDDGVSSGSLGDHRPTFIGAPRDISSPLALFLKECSRGGLFPAQEIPSELRP